MRDSVGMTLLDMGKDPEKFDDDDFDAAIARLQKAVDSKQIRRFTGNDYTSRPQQGRHRRLPGLGRRRRPAQGSTTRTSSSRIPDSGYHTSTDNLLVPAKARHKTNAERLIDYYYEPKVAAELAAYINYVCPVDGVAGRAGEDRQGRSPTTR